MRRTSQVSHSQVSHPSKVNTSLVIQLKSATDAKREVRGATKWLTGTHASATSLSRSTRRLVRNVERFALANHGAHHARISSVHGAEQEWVQLRLYSRPCRSPSACSVHQRRDPRSNATCLHSPLCARARHSCSTAVKARSDR